ncbi:MAG: lipoyl synthase [Candidatus Bipolaricaulota bacterium]|nr:lipoyl synthase [Candidatus Bipolaricaulota bacterium]
MNDRPVWLRVRAPSEAEAEGMRAVRDVLDAERLHTICQGAQCPNVVECWSARTATFLLLGEICTRACRFCAVRHAARGEELDPSEPDRVAAAVQRLGLRYAVLTSVDRDDLPDGGSVAIAETVMAIKRRSPETRVEVLLPDFGGDPRALSHVLSSGADVLGHNLETVRRISPALRDARASYERSLDVLAYLRLGSEGRPVKSGLMLGLGEELGEIREAMGDLLRAGVTSLTLGQYLAPSRQAAPIRRYVHPDEFNALAREARAAGFVSVASGPLVRSSYHAEAASTDPCDSSST